MNFSRISAGGGRNSLPLFLTGIVGALALSLASCGGSSGDDPLAINVPSADKTNVKDSTVSS